jgi:hypothetical protein
LTIEDDLSGLAQPSVLNTRNYKLRRGVYGRPLPIGLSGSPRSAPNGPQRVEILINHGARLIAGIYFLQVASGGIEVLAGNDLAGRFRGKSPTGPRIAGKPGSADFRVSFTVSGHRAGAPKPVSPFKTNPKR